MLAVPRVTDVTRLVWPLLVRHRVPLATGGSAFALAIAGLVSLALVPAPTVPPQLVALGPTVAVEQLPRRSPSPSPSPSEVPPLPDVPAGPTQPPNQLPPAGPPPAPPAPDRPPAASVAEAVANAYAVGSRRASRVAVAVLDRQTWTFYGAGATDSWFASASVVKVFIAARLLVEGRAEDPAVRDRMRRMITCSDDNAANVLYYAAGGEGLAGWISTRYGISVGATPQPGWWGLTRISARAMVSFYAQIAGEPQVGPWLMGAMASASTYGCDGYYQHFGIPSAATSWRVKQGWMCCLDGLTRMHSTGFVDSDRYTVALMIEGSTSLYSGGGGQALTAMAKALLPKGKIPQPPPTPSAAPTATPTATPSADSSPSPQTTAPTTTTTTTTTSTTTTSTTTTTTTASTTTTTASVPPTAEATDPPPTADPTAESPADGP